MENWLSSWKPQDSFMIEFDDKSGRKRSQKELNEMVDKMREVANDHGFDLHTIGLPKGMFKMLKNIYGK